MKIKEEKKRNNDLLDVCHQSSLDQKKQERQMQQDNLKEDNNYCFQQEKVKFPELTTSSRNDSSFNEELNLQSFDKSKSITKRENIANKSVIDDTQNNFSCTNRNTISLTQRKSQQPQRNNLFNLPYIKNPQQFKEVLNNQQLKLRKNQTQNQVLDQIITKSFIQEVQKEDNLNLSIIDQGIDEKNQNKYDSNDELNNTQELLQYQPAQIGEDSNFEEQLDMKPTKQRTTLYELQNAYKNKHIFNKNDAQQQSIICSTVNIEPHLRRAIQKIGWQENPISNSNTFHIKFDITDKEGSNNKLKPSQWYNHFPSNREITTKAGLCKNLWNQCPYEHEMKISHFFPRCYDLSDQKQLDNFLTDYNQTAILSIVKRFALHFVRINTDLTSLISEYDKKNNFQNNKIYKQQFKLKCAKLDLTQKRNGQFLGNDRLRFAIQYVKTQILSLYQQDKKRNKERLEQSKFKQDEIEYLVEYSQQISDQSIAIESFSTYDQIKTFKTHLKLQKLFQQYNVIDGKNNVWVVKPSYNARGLGVYCTNKIKDITQQYKKVQSKIVQKYIENPYLVDRRKFDIRQWVLVTSWEPLDIYVFETAYLKMCSNQFDLNNLSDQYSHLSNYTIQKNNKSINNEDLIMSHTQFEKYVQQNTQYQSYSWKEDLYPKICDLVFKTMKSTQEVMENRNNCFEVYGFDIILDQFLDPWLIEVNLSPACNERAEWLTKMLDDMNFDLLQYLNDNIIIQSDDWINESINQRRKQLLKRQKTNEGNQYLNQKEFYKEHQIQHKWLRIDQCINEYRVHQVSYQYLFQQNKQQMDVLGNKHSLRQEKNLEKKYMKAKATKMIQRVMKGFYS